MFSAPKQSARVLKFYIRLTVSKISLAIIESFQFCFFTTTVVFILMRTTFVITMLRYPFLAKRRASLEKSYGENCSISAVASPSRVPCKSKNIVFSFYGKFHICGTNASGEAHTTQVCTVFL